MSDKQTKKILDRVRKLMAMAADGASPHEATIAAERARKLMDKHQISVEDLVANDGFATCGVGAIRKFTPKWEQSMAIAIAEYNDCLAAFQYMGQGPNGGYQLTFKGFESDVMVCRYMLQYLVDNCKRQCSRHMRLKGYTRYNTTVGTMFKEAYSTEVCNKIDQMIADREAQAEPVVADGKSLMVIKQDLVAQEFGEAKYGTYRMPTPEDMAGLDATKAGAKAGRDASIHTGVGSEDSSGNIHQIESK